jgi:hypothetical protein
VRGREQASERNIDSDMAEKSEVFSSAESMDSRPFSTHIDAHYRRDLLEIAVVFGCILIAVWTPQGKANAFFSMVAAACVVAFAIVGRWGARDMGLTRPGAGLGYILAAGAVLCGVIALIGIPLRLSGAGNPLPLSRSWQYSFWALQQEIILQSIFFLRLEPMLGSRRAVIAAASLFAIVHIPSPILTVLSFCGGILFCELFRRWRNLYPLGIIHGALGLTIAASLPDRWLHHMRVGIGYLMLHP